MDDDLKLATSKQLIMELLTRFPTVMLFAQPGDDAPDNKNAVCITQGSGFTILGASMLIAEQTKERLSTDRRPATEEEEFQ